MKQPKNHLTITLMISSMILLVTLQVLWLTSSYEKAFYDFRARASGLFRNAVFTVRDSSLLRNIKTIPNDSLVQFESEYHFDKKSDIANLPPVGRVKRLDFRRSRGQIQIYIASSARADSLKGLLQPFVSHVRDNPFKDGSRFIIRLDQDSLNTDSIRAQFARNLSTAELLVPFEIRSEFHTGPFTAPFHSRTGINGIVLRRNREKDEARTILQPRSFQGAASSRAPSASALAASRTPTCSCSSMPVQSSS